MVIVFVVWVGFGPFSGSLALSLHTVAALSKLYSKQVESVMTGPLEAIHATGTTRMKTIIYGVVPQIVPRYLSFTMYRWDINVRMSTIIGFAGGGGIGFLLQQNINLFQYKMRQRRCSLSPSWSPRSTGSAPVSVNDWHRTPPE